MLARCADKPAPENAKFANVSRKVKFVMTLITHQHSSTPNATPQRRHDTWRWITFYVVMKSVWSPQ